MAPWSTKHLDKQPVKELRLADLKTQKADCFAEAVQQRKEVELKTDAVFHHGGSDGRGGGGC